MPNENDLEFSTDLDTTLNIKINSQLKEEFERLCRASHSNMSREIKILMSKAVKAKTLNTSQWFCSQIKSLLLVIIGFDTNLNKDCL